MARQNGLSRDFSFCAVLSRSDPRLAASGRAPVQRNNARNVTMRTTSFLRPILFTLKMFLYFHSLFLLEISRWNCQFSCWIWRELIQSLYQAECLYRSYTGEYPKFFRCKKRWISLKLGLKDSLIFQHSSISSYKSRWQFLGQGREGGDLFLRAESISASDSSWYGRIPAKLRISHKHTPNDQTSDLVVYRCWKINNIRMERK